jgi:hypothetical protein
MRQADMILQMKQENRGKINETVPDSNLNLIKSMTHHNQTKELTLGFLMLKRGIHRCRRCSTSLASVLQSREATGQITQWAIEIGQYDVEFIPRLMIKSQALVSFIAEWMDLGLWGINDLPDHWVIYIDGSYTLKGARAGVVLIPPEGDLLKYALHL